MHPDYPVILAANRDEVRTRPSTGPRRWPGSPALWAGRDEVAGGTWLGVNERGMVVAITNRRDGTVDAELPSRGMLCLEVLRQPGPAEGQVYVHDALASSHYNPFNLVCAGPRDGWSMTWRGDARRLGVGAHVVTNHGDSDDAMLPEVERGLAYVAELDVWTTPLHGLLELLAALCRDTRGPNPICRAGGDRGTVSSSLIAVRVDGSLAAYWHADGPPSDPSHPYEALPPVALAVPPHQ
jgi:hypothetical protein